MTTTLPSNGTRRKTLAVQLDRLDSILDALDVGLKEAVTSAVQDAVSQAVREGVQQAVQGLVSGLLTNPDALAMLRAGLAPEATAPPPPPPPPPTPMPETKPSRMGGVGSWLMSRARQTCQVVCAGARQAANVVREGLRLVKPYRKPLLIAAGVGTALAVCACVAGPVVAAPAAWVGGFLSALAVRAGVALRRGLDLDAALA